MGNSIFSEFKGALAEQFILQHLKTRQFIQVFYWSSDISTGELDIVIQSNDRVIPIEVKAEENLQAKSLKSFHQKFNPTISVRTSMSDYRKETWLINVPLYAFDSIRFISELVVVTGLPTLTGLEALSGLRPIDTKIGKGPLKPAAPDFT